MLSEATLYLVWTNQLFIRENLKTVGGSSLEVLFPGVRNHAAGGPDFTDSVLSINGNIVRCDVEMHQRSSDWIRHAHGSDMKYSNVLLHVVFECDNISNELRNPAGNIIETLALSDKLDRPAEDIARVLDPDAGQAEHNEPNIPACSKLIAMKPINEHLAVSVISNFAALRYIEKTREFEDSIAKDGPEKAFLTGFLRCLGFSNNKKAFVMLGNTICDDALKNNNLDGSTGLDAYLFSSSGLMPKKYLHFDAETVEYVHGLEKALAENAMRDSVMKREYWNFGCVRPSNFPHRRLAGLSCAVAVNRNDFNLLPIFLKFYSSPDSKRDSNRLMRSLVGWFSCLSHPYWDCRTDFGSTRFPYPVSIIGSSRVAEIVVNHLSPFFAAYSRFEGHSLENVAKAVYTSASDYLMDNFKVRKVIGSIAGDGMDIPVSKALLYQGCVHLYDRYCANGIPGCRRCLLRRLLEDRK